MSDAGGIALDTIAAAIGDRLRPGTMPPRPEPGECLTWSAQGLSQRYFIKSGDTTVAPRLAAEAAGLAELALAGMPVPKVVANVSTDSGAFLVLEHLDLRALDRDSGRILGGLLATLHAQTAEAFGGSRNNFIGPTPQDNAPHRTWPHFFAHRRLAPQLALAATHGMDRATLSAGEQLAADLAGFFTGYQPRPSLLHGDLWGGNAGAVGAAGAVVYDPAAYYGDREADIAMTELFGGFPDSFYAAYREQAPLDAGYETCKQLYNLYHVLNHYALFGEAYLGQARRMIARLNAELR